MFPHKEESTIMSTMQQIKASRESFRNGLALYAKGNYTESLKQFRRAVQLQEPAFGKYHKETIRSYLHQGKACLMLAEQDPKMTLKALQSFQRATRMANTSFSKTDKQNMWADIESCWYSVHPTTDMSLTGLTQIFAQEELGDKATKKGDYVKAIEHYAEALSLQDSLVGKDSLDGADIRYKLGSSLIKTKATPQAQRTLQQAYTCYVRTVGMNHPATMGCESKINAIVIS
jgi:tetratricopeptide (TPR) repeat protein